MALALLLFLAALAVDPAAFDPLRWKESLVLSAGALVLAGSALVGTLGRAAREDLPRGFLPLAGCVLASVAGTFLLAAHPGEAWRTTALWLVLLFTAVIAWQESFETPLRLPVAVALAALPLGVLAFFQSAGHDPLFGAPRAGEGPFEAVLTFGNSNAAGEFLAPVVPLLCALALARGSFVSRLLGAFAAPLACGALLLTHSRGALLAALSGVLTTAFLLSRRARGALLLLALLGAALPFAVLQDAGAYGLKSVPESPASVLSPAYGPNKQRLLLLEAAADMALARPFLGHGPGQFAAEFPPYRDPEEARLPTASGGPSRAEDPHDLYALLACEGGALLLLLFVLLAVAAWRAGALARVLAPDDPHVAVAAGLRGALVALLVMGLFRSLLSQPATALLLAAVCGALLAYDEGPRPGRAPKFGAGTLVVLGALALPCVVGGRGFLSDWTFSRGWDRYLDEPTRTVRDVEIDLERAARLDPSNRDVLAVLGGTVYLRPGADGPRLAAAERTFAHLLRLEPHDPWAREGLAEAAARRGRADFARTQLDIAWRLLHGAPPKEALDPVRSLVDRGRFEAAAAFVAHLLKNGEVGEGTVEDAALAAEQGGKARTALAWVAPLTALHPYRAALAERAGRLAKDVGDEEDAAEYYRRARLGYALENLGARRYAQARRDAKLAGAGRGPVPRIEEELVVALADAAENSVKTLDSDLVRRGRAADPEFLRALRLLDANPDLLAPIQSLGPAE